MNRLGLAWLRFPEFSVCRCVGRCSFGRAFCGRKEGREEGRKGLLMYPVIYSELMVMLVRARGGWMDGWMEGGGEVRLFRGARLGREGRCGERDGMGGLMMGDGVVL